MLPLSCQGYMKYDSPTGNVRTSVRAPAATSTHNSSASDMAYCSASAAAHPWKANCSYVDGLFAEKGGGQSNAFALSTRFSLREEELPADCGYELTGSYGSPSQLNSPACGGWVRKSSVPKYVADIEDFTVFMDHSVTSFLLDKTLTWDSDGLHNLGIYDESGNAIDPCDDYPAGDCPSFIRVEDGKRPIVRLRTLLRAAGVDLDTTVPGVNICADGDDDGEVTPAECEPFRYSGLLMQISLEYSNQADGTVDIKFIPHLFPEAEWKMEEIGLDGDNNPATRLVYNHHGIRVFYKQT
eukprot:SAG22_NODE_5437_length_1013_cov_13.920131_1_plen_296_part_01